MNEKLEEKLGTKIVQVSSDDVFKLLSEGVAVYRLCPKTMDFVDLAYEQVQDVVSYIDEYGDLGNYVYFILKETTF